MLTNSLHLIVHVCTCTIHVSIELRSFDHMINHLWEGSNLKMGCGVCVFNWRCCNMHMG